MQKATLEKKSSLSLSSRVELLVFTIVMAVGLADPDFHPDSLDQYLICFAVGILAAPFIVAIFTSEFARWLAGKL